MAPSLVRDIRELGGAVRPGDFLIPAEHPSARSEAMDELSRQL